MSLKNKNRRFETTKICPRIANGLVLELKQQAKQRKTTESSLLEAALKTFLSQTEHESVMDRRLNKIQSQNEEIRREQQILLETLAAFVKVYLGHTPEIPESQKRLAEENALERFKRFATLVSSAFENETWFGETVKERIMAKKDFTK